MTLLSALPRRLPGMAAMVADHSIDPEWWLSQPAEGDPCCPLCGREHLLRVEVLNGRCEVCCKHYLEQVEEQSSGAEVLAKRAGVPKRYRMYRQERWRGQWPTEARAWEEKGGLMLVTGPTGHGKTLLVTALLYQRLTVAEGAWYDAADLVSYARDEQLGHGDQGRTVGRRVREISTLVIDDLGKGHVTDYYVATLDEILRHRHLHSRATLINTQMDARQIEESNPALYRRLTEDHPVLEL